MIPMIQTRFGPPSASVEEQGDCFAACLCSLLHVPLDVAPWVDLMGDLWWPAMLDFVAQHNYDLLRLQPEWERALGPQTHYIASGRSPRGNFLHSVLKKAGFVVHDPYPDGCGIKDLVDIIVLVWRS